MVQARRLPLLASFAALLWGSLAVPAHATVVQAKTLEEMTLACEVIAEVVVTGQRVVEENKRIVTYTTLAVKDGVRGVKSGDVLEVFQLGGELGDKAAWIAGAHRFHVGEALVFFGSHHLAKGAASNVVIPYGVGYGLFAVVDDLSGRKVVEILGDVVAVELDAEGRATPTARVPRRFDSLEGFKATLRRTLDGQPPQQLPRREKLKPVLAPAGGAR